MQQVPIITPDLSELEFQIRKKFRNFSLKKIEKKLQLTLKCGYPKKKKKRNHQTQSR